MCTFEHCNTSLFLSLLWETQIRHFSMQSSISVLPGEVINYVFNKMFVQKPLYRLPPISNELCFRAGGKALITTRNWINIHWCSYTEWIPINPKQLIQFRNTQKRYLIQHKEMTGFVTYRVTEEPYARMHSLTHSPHLKWEIRLSSNPVQHYGGLPFYVK